MRAWAFLLTGILVFLSANATAQNKCSSDSTQASEQVSKFFNDGIAHFNTHDASSFLAQFADDVEMYTPTGWVRGKAAISQRFAQTFQQFPRVKMVTSDRMLGRYRPKPSWSTSFGKSCRWVQDPSSRAPVAAFTFAARTRGKRCWSTRPSHSLTQPCSSDRRSSKNRRTAVQAVLLWQARVTTGGEGLRWSCQWSSSRNHSRGKLRRRSPRE